jgi:membrane-associated protease RseP (regulator of RpoE activity)
VGLLTIGCLPFSGYVSFDSIEDFDAKPAWQRSLVSLAGPCLTFLLSVALLGLLQAGHHFISGFSEMISGALSPLTRGTSLLHAFFELSRHSFTAAVGVFAAKLTSYNLLPVPVMAGGRFLLELTSIKRTNRTVELIQTLCAFLIIAFLISWLVALGNYWAHPG